MRRVGRRPAARPTASEAASAVASRRLRAAEEPLDVRVRYRAPVLELEVRNPAHQTRYRVLLPEFPDRAGALCTCTDFARRGLGTCKHLEAGWEWLARHPELPDAPARPGSDLPIEELGSEIDRRTDRLRSEAPTDIRQLEAVGAVLIDPDTKETAEEVGRGAKDGRPTSTSRARP